MCLSTPISIQGSKIPTEIRYFTLGGVPSPQDQRFRIEPPLSICPLSSQSFLRNEDSGKVAGCQVSRVVWFGGMKFHNRKLGVVYPYTYVPTNKIHQVIGHPLIICKVSSTVIHLITLLDYLQTFKCHTKIFQQRLEIDISHLSYSCA